VTGAEAALAAAAVALAALVQSGTGFGFALLAGPALVAILPPVPAISAIALLGLLVNAVTLAAARRRPRVRRREAATLLAWALPGLPVGVVLLTRLPDDVVEVAVGVLVLLAVAQRLSGFARVLPAPAAGLLTGALTTSTGLNGPPLVVRLAALPIAFDERRDTLAALFLALGVLGVAALAIGGTFAPPAATAPLAVLAVAGNLAGRRVRLGPRADRWAVGLLLAGAGTASIASGLAG
jgi:uncharacterized membrane protein YfcA